MFACSSAWPRGGGQLDVLGGRWKALFMSNFANSNVLMAVPTVMYVRLRRSFGIPSLIL